MHLVNKVGGIANDQERAITVYVVLPVVQVIVVLERQVEPPVFRLKEKATGLEVGSLYVGDISKVDNHRHGSGLEGMKMRLSRH